MDASNLLGYERIVFRRLMEHPTADLDGVGGSQSQHVPADLRNMQCRAAAGHTRHGNIGAAADFSVVVDADLAGNLSTLAVEYFSDGRP